MSLDTFIPGISIYSRALPNGGGQLQLRQLSSEGGFSTGRERYALWLINEKQLTLTGFCLKYADKLTGEEYRSLLTRIHSREDFQCLAGEYEQKWSDGG